MTRETFDYLIYFVIALGSVLAIIRIYRDLTRPLPEEQDDPFNNQ